MPHIPVTREVSQPERSREESEEQPQNISPMYVTREVSRYERSKDSTASRRAKSSLEFSGAETPLSMTTDLTSSLDNASYHAGWTGAISPDTPSVG